MIVHQYPDGSQGFQYELGDRVTVKRTVHGGWFDVGPTNAEVCVVHSIDARSHWAIAFLYVRYSDDWGPAYCAPWGVEPHADTLAAATDGPEFQFA